MKSAKLLATSVAWKERISLSLAQKNNNQTAFVLSTEATKAKGTELKGRTVANGSGENKELAFSACGVIKDILSALSGVLFKVIRMPRDFVRDLFFFAFPPSGAAAEVNRSNNDDSVDTAATIVSSEFLDECSPKKSENPPVKLDIVENGRLRSFFRNL